ncbi:MAG: glutaminyl-peptide cyclotransferase [Corynebacterium sp.]|nr:glutaminyl-peptide cyclotransferase [Corynebacterium sp.]
MLVHTFSSTPAGVLLAAVTSVSLFLCGCSSEDEGNTTASSASTSQRTPNAPELGAQDDLLAVARNEDIAVLTPKIVQTYPFDATSFTQGLEYDAGREEILVGTGQYGESRIYRSSLDGEQHVTAALDPDFFGEGIATTSEKIWQITWQDEVAIARDPETLAEQERVKYSGEGWGLCTIPATKDAPERLVLSDGSAQLSIRDAASFAELERIPVTLAGAGVTNLNELACVSQADTPEDLGAEFVVYANIFLSTDVVRIAFDDANRGEVTAVIDGAALPNNASANINNVLNGIAHVPGTAEYLMTGKRWPDLYRVEFVAPDI